jgi:A/G-specific adenine glycosylase
VLARYFGIDTPVDTAAGKKLFTSLAHDVLPKSQAGIYNQAIMDFGAVVCKPQQPLCKTCTLAPCCEAFQKGLTDLVPVKSKKLIIKKRYFHFLLLEQDGRIWIRKRTGKDIWQNLHEFPLVETPAPADLAALRETAAFRQLLPESPKALDAGVQLRQQLTHQTIHASFIRFRLSPDFTLPGDYMLVPEGQLERYAFPKIITDFLNR